MDEFPARNRASPSAVLETLVARARLAGLWERLWPPLVALFIVCGLFVTVSWLGLWLNTPWWGRALGLAAVRAGPAVARMASGGRQASLPIRRARPHRPGQQPSAPARDDARRRAGEFLRRRGDHGPLASASAPRGKGRRLASRGGACAKDCASGSFRVPRRRPACVCRRGLRRRPSEIRARGRSIRLQSRFEPGRGLSARCVDRSPALHRAAPGSPARIGPGVQDGDAARRRARRIHRDRAHVTGRGHRCRRAGRLWRQSKRRPRTQPQSRRARRRPNRRCGGPCRGTPRCNCAVRAAR